MSIGKFVEDTQLEIDILARHWQYGPRCRGCDHRWPCDPVRAAKQIIELRTKIKLLKEQIERLKNGGQTNQN